MRRVSRSGMTLIEAMLATAVLVVAITALLGAFLGQTLLNEHARHLTWAINDANRVMESLRQLNINCSTPSAALPIGTQWDNWLADTTALGGGGKSVQPDPNLYERIFVTCQDRDGGASSTDYCATNQTGSGEWHQKPAGPTSYDPIRVTVSVCWRERNRTIGECTWNTGSQTFSANDADGDGVIESPAMLSTLMTCRQ